MKRLLTLRKAVVDTQRLKTGSNKKISSAASLGNLDQNVKESILKEL